MASEDENWFLGGEESSSMAFFVDDEPKLPLHAAAFHLKVDEVDRLLTEDKVDVNEKDEHGKCALHYVAAKLGERSVDVIDRLLSEQNIDVSLSDNVGMTPLHCAAREENNDNLARLLAVPGIDVAYVNNDGQTALGIALERGSLTLVNSWLNTGADAQGLDEDKLAQLYSEWDHMGYSLFHVGDHDDASGFGDEKWTPLHFAARFDHSGVARHLLSTLSVDPSPRDSLGKNPLLVAAQWGSVEVFDLLLAAGADASSADNEGRTALHYAARNGHVKCVDRLLSLSDLDISALSRDSPGMVDLSTAIEHCQIHVVNRLLCPSVCLNSSSIGGETLAACYKAAKRSSIFDEKRNAARPKGSWQDRKWRGAPSNQYLRSYTDDYNANGWHALHYSTFCGHEHIVAHLISVLSVPVSPKDALGRTPLHIAARWGGKDIVRYLLSSGADVSCVDNEKRTPLHGASRCGHVDVVDLLLSVSHIDVSSKNDNGQTPLHVAAASGFVDVVDRLLLSGGADPSDTDSSKHTALHVAAKEGHVDVVARLLKVPNIDVSPGAWSASDTPLRLAANSGHVQVVDRLLRAGADTSSTDMDKRTVLHDAAACGYVEIVDRLFELPGVDASPEDIERKTPLLVAAENGHKDVVRRLISSGAKVSHAAYRQRTALHHASRNGHVAVVEELLCAQNIDPSARDLKHVTPLHLASKHGFVKIVDLLLSANADPSRVDEKDRTALHHAVLGDHPDVVSRLLSAPDIDTSIVDCAHQTALHLAAAKGRCAIIERFISDPDASVSPVDKYGNTPLHLAAREGHTKAVVCLLSAPNANASPVDRWLQTPLHLAAANGRPRVVRHLASLPSADLSMVDEGGDSVLGAAARGGHAKLVWRLLSTGSVEARLRKMDVRDAFGVAVKKIGEHESKQTMDLITVLATHRDVEIDANSFHRILEFRSKNVGRITGHDKLDDFIIRKHLSQAPIVRDMAEFRDLRELSSGNFGITYSADLTLPFGSSYHVVLKVAKAETGADEWYELQTLQNLPTSPCVVPLVGICTDFAFDPAEPAKTALVIPFFDGGSLLGYLNSRTAPLPLSTLLDIASDMVRGVSYLHSNGYKHNDIAARNFLLSSRDFDENSGARVIIADFGLTRPTSYRFRKPCALPWAWVAPEVLRHGPTKLSAQSDVWMVGIALWELLGTKESPFFQCGNPSVLLEEFNCGRVPLQFPHWTDENFKSLVLACCALDPLSRPTAEEVLRRLLDLNGKAEACNHSQNRDTDGSSCTGEVNEHEVKTTEAPQPSTSFGYPDELSSCFAGFSDDGWDASDDDRQDESDDGSDSGSSGSDLTASEVADEIDDDHGQADENGNTEASPALSSYSQADEIQADENGATEASSALSSSDGLDESGQDQVLSEIAFDEERDDHRSEAADGFSSPPLSSGEQEQNEMDASIEEANGTDSNNYGVVSLNEGDSNEEELDVCIYMRDWDAGGTVSDVEPPGEVHHDSSDEEDHGNEVKTSEVAPTSIDNSAEPENTNMHPVGPSSPASSPTGASASPKAVSNPPRLSPRLHSNSATEGQKTASSQREPEVTASSQQKPEVAASLPERPEVTASSQHMPEVKTSQQKPEGTTSSQKIPRATQVSQHVSSSHTTAAKTAPMKKTKKKKKKWSALNPPSDDDSDEDQTRHLHVDQCASPKSGVSRKDAAESKTNANHGASPKVGVDAKLKGEVGGRRENGWSKDADIDVPRNDAAESKSDTKSEANPNITFCEPQSSDSDRDANLTAEQSEEDEDSDGSWGSAEIGDADDLSPFQLLQEEEIQRPKTDEDIERERKTPENMHAIKSGASERKNESGDSNWSSAEIGNGGDLSPNQLLPAEESQLPKTSDDMKTLDSTQAMNPKESRKNEGSDGNRSSTEIGDADDLSPFQLQPAEEVQRQKTSEDIEREKKLEREKVQRKNRVKFLDTISTVVSDLIMAGATKSEALDAMCAMINAHNRAHGHSMNMRAMLQEFSWSILDERFERPVDLKNFSHALQLVRDLDEKQPLRAPGVRKRLPNEHKNDTDANARPWNCPKCTFLNKPVHLVCEICGARKPISAAKREVVKPSTLPSEHKDSVDSSARTWNCTACTFENGPSFLLCEMCGAAKPVLSHRDDAKGESPVADNSCGESKPVELSVRSQLVAVEQVKCTPELQNPLPNEHKDDVDGSPRPWNCPTCTFENEADVVLCEMCGGGKTLPATELAVGPLSDTELAIGPLPDTELAVGPLPATDTKLAVGPLPATTELAARPLPDTEFAVGPLPATELAMAQPPVPASALPGDASRDDSTESLVTNNSCGEQRPAKLSVNSQFVASEEAECTSELQHEVRNEHKDGNDVSSGVWNCTKCTFENRPDFPVCSMCGTERPVFSHRDYDSGDDRKESMVSDNESGESMTAELPTNAKCVADEKTESPRQDAASSDWATSAEVRPSPVDEDSDGSWGSAEVGDADDLSPFQLLQDEEIQRPKTDEDIERERKSLESMNTMKSCNFERKTYHLHAAVLCGDVKEVDRLLADANIDVNEKDENGCSALYLAVVWRYFVIVNLILQTDRFSAANEIDALCHACTIGVADMVELLISFDKMHQISNVKDWNHRTPLHYAAGCYSIHKYSGLKVNEKNDYDHDRNVYLFPIHLGSVGERVRITDRLLRAGADPSAVDRKYAALHYAAFNKYQGVVERLLSVPNLVAWPDLEDLPRKTPLHVAAEHGYADIVELMVSAGVDVGAIHSYNVDGDQWRDWTALHYAARYDHVDVFELLLAAPFVDDGSSMYLTSTKLYGEITPLHVAAKYGSRKVFELLLSNNADVPDTVLHYAAAKGHTFFVKSLLALPQIDISARDIDGLTPLHHAAGKLFKDGEIVDMLLSAGANASLVCHRRRTALHYAAESGSSKHVEQLLSVRDINVSASDSTGRTALHEAISAGQEEIALQLVSAGVRVTAVDENKESVFHLMAKGHRWSGPAIERLLSVPGIDISLGNENGMTPLHIAAKHGRHEYVDLLLNAGADVSAVNWEGKTALHFAAEQNSVYVLDRLLYVPGIDVCAKDKSDNTPLHYAALRGHVSVLERLLAAGADPSFISTSSGSALHWALVRGSDAMIEPLISAGADISSFDRSGRTVLLLAAKEGRSKAVKRLLSAGADPSCTDEEKATPLHLASRGGHNAVVRRLLAADVDVSCVDDKGQTALHTAVCEGHFNTVTRLLAAGANASCADNDKLTPLHYAVREGHFGIANRLLSSGADTSCVDMEKRTPLFDAIREGRLDLVDRLLSVGADVSCVDQNGQTVLHEAASTSGHDNSLVIFDRLLTIDNIDPSARDYRMRTPLHLAAHIGFSGAVSRLLSIPGIDISSADSNLSTPFHLAAASGSLGVVDQFLALPSFVFPSAGDAYGNTPLHGAAMNGSYGVVQRLLELDDVDVKHINKDGLTPFDLAVQMIGTSTHDEFTTAKVLKAFAESEKIQDINVDTSSFFKILEFRAKRYPRKTITGHEELDDIIIQNHLSHTSSFKDVSDFVKVRELSSGFFGTTYFAELKLPRDAALSVVLKVSKEETGADEWYELQALKNLPSNANVLPLLGVCTNFAFGSNDLAKTALILPFVNGGSLRDYLNKLSEPLAFADIVDFAIDMTFGVLHLHRNGFKHNDISAKNFLLSSRAHGDYMRTKVLIADFGMTRRLSDQLKEEVLLPWRFSAPEVLNSGGTRTSTNSDIWMLGIALWELLTVEKVPFSECRNSATLMKEFEDHRVPLHFHEGTNEHLKELILACCALDPASRPPVEEVLFRLGEMQDRCKAQAVADNLLRDEEENEHEVKTAKVMTVITASDHVVPEDQAQTPADDPPTEEEEHEHELKTIEVTTVSAPSDDVPRGRDWRYDENAKGFANAYSWLKSLVKRGEQIRSLQIPKDKAKTALRLAVKADDARIVELLVTRLRGKPIFRIKFKSGATLLHLSGYNVTKVLLRAPGIDVNHADSKGRTPLHAAAGSGSRTTELLVKAPGVDVNCVDKNGRTPLHRAAIYNRFSILPALLSAPSLRVNAASHRGNTPLHEAARMVEDDDADFVRMLLAVPGIKVNVVNSEEEMPLHIAARLGHNGVIRRLLAHPEIDAAAKDGNGMTPHDIAERNRRHTAVDMLLAHCQHGTNGRDPE